MRQLANRIAHWNLYTGFQLLILPVACVLAHWSPVIECLFVPHLEMRSRPLLAAYTSSKPCYCSGCIPEALLTYSSPYSAENIPDCSPLCHSLRALPIYSVTTLECLHRMQCLSGCQRWSCIHVQTQRGETPWVWREFVTRGCKTLRFHILIYVQQDATLHSSFYLETALHVSGGTTTHHQERKQLYLQHLIFVTPLLLPAANSGR